MNLSQIEKTLLKAFSKHKAPRISKESLRAFLLKNLTKEELATIATIYLWNKK